ncbi:MAG: GyrI-like domain-containing protein [Halanaerobiales bacterium]
MSEYKQEKGITFLAGVEVTDFGDLPSKMKGKVISEGTYAIFTHKGLIIEIEKTFEYIYGTWMHESGYEILQKPCFSYYDQRFKFNSKKSELNIYIPVK